MGSGRPIPDRLRHWIRLCPDAIGPEPPTPALELEGDSPRDADQIFRLESRGPLVHPTGLLGPRAIPTGESRSLPSLLAREPGGVGGVGIAEVQPERPVRPQDPMDFVEHAGEMLNEPFGGGLQAELAEPSPASPAGRPAPRGIASDRGLPSHSLAGDVMRPTMAWRPGRFPFVFTPGLSAPPD